jgi:hypothetical protein
MPRGAWGFVALIVATCGLSAEANGAGRDPHRIWSASRAQHRFVDGEVVVRFKEGTDRNGRAAVLRDTGATRKKWLRIAGGELLRLPHGTSVEQAVRAL